MPILHGLRSATWRAIVRAAICASVLAAMTAASGSAQVVPIKIAPPITSLVGIVGDSLHGGPLAGAVIVIDGELREAVTDSVGRFRIDSLSAGQYRLGIFHPTLDSLGTSLSSKPVRFTGRKPLLVSLATPSGRTIRRAFCPEIRNRKQRYEHADTGVAVLVGRVVDPETELPIVAATVAYSWIETAFQGANVRVVPYQHQTTTDMGGDFHFCDLPSGLSGTLRAYGTDERTVVQREMSLDNRIVTMATIHLPRDGATARAVFAGDVERPDGSPLPGAIITVSGAKDSAISGADGSFTIRGLPTGTHMVLVRYVGFEPITEVVELANAEPQRLSLVFNTPAHRLPGVLVLARRLKAGYARVGFDVRQHAGVGQFLTLDDIEALHATNFSQIFATLKGVQLSYTPAGTNIESSRNLEGCLVYFLDGHPFNRMTDGELDVLFSPDEIAGVEVYSGASVPAEFRERSLPGTNPGGVRVAGFEGCTTVVVWTRTRLGLHVDDD